MTFVPTFVQRPARKAKVFAGELVVPGRTTPSPWLRPDDPLPPGPFSVFPAKGPDVNLAKGVAWANAICVSSVLIVRKSLAEPILRKLVESGDVVLRDVRVMRAHPRKNLDWKSGTLDDDFALVDVRARFPADRASLPENAWEKQGKGGTYASLLEWVPPEATFGKGHAPRTPMFRVGEQPSLLFTEKKLFEKLDRALGGALREGEMGPRFGMLDAFTEPRFEETAADAEAAANAFYRMYAAERSSAKGRKLALRSAVWSYWLARLVDRAAAEDTRAAACTHPFYAYAYARDVDRAPHDLTRRSVRSDTCATKEYAIHVDRGVNDVTRKALGYDATRVELEADANAARFTHAADASPAGATSRSAGSVSSDFFMLGFAPDGRGVVPGSYRTAGARLHSPYARRAPGVGVFVADEYGGKGRLRKQASLAHLFALNDGAYGPFIVRRSAVAELFADIPKEDLELVPIALHDAKGRLDADFALLDVKTYVPIDKEASKVKLAHPKAPVTGGVRIVTTFAWSAARRPRARIFRVLEFPEVLVVDAELAAALEKATRRAVQRFVKQPTDAHLSPLTPPPASVNAKDEAAAKAAMEAFALYNARKADDTSKEAARERKAALSHPLGALAVAAAIDRAPSDETRKAVLGSPTAAVDYALLVDRGPHELTRKAACRTPQTAYRYVRDVDIGFHPLTRASLGRPGSGPGESRELEEELASVRRDLKANAPPAPGARATKR
jgi:hypothetical protein